ncbi:MAG: Uma2 family endonuclease [Isosphaeraceae bacterium]
MATATFPSPITRVGPTDHGCRMTLDEFIQADFQEGWLYELARGVVEVTEVPGPRHGRIVNRVTRMFILYDEHHPGRIRYRAGAGECRMRLPGMVSDRHPDQAIYLDPEPPGPRVWTRWVPHIVVEILSPGGEDRDLIDKREEYLRVGVREYWILDPERRHLIVLTREGDTWDETIIPESGVYQTIFLPGLEVRPAELLGTAPAM